jgi:hypothetical protein
VFTKIAIVAVMLFAMARGLDAAPLFIAVSKFGPTIGTREGPEIIFSDKEYSEDKWLGVPGGK